MTSHPQEAIITHDSINKNAQLTTQMRFLGSLLIEKNLKRVGFIRRRVRNRRQCAL